MPVLTIDALGRLRTRLTAGETDIETASQDYSITELAQGFQETRGQLQALADGWTQDQLLTRPPLEDREDIVAGLDRWSATEAISHLIATQNWYMLHMGHLLGRREQFDVMPRGLGDHARQDIRKGELTAALRSATDRFLAYIAAIPADADWTQKRSSIFFGDLSLRGWVLLSALHDEDHLQQIWRLAALPTFPADIA
jgi:hypothetical protein